MPTNETCPHVLVTRPSHQASALCDELVAHNFQPICFPTIQIASTENRQHAIEQLQTSNQANYIIFISANAVWQADCLLNKQWPALKTVVAIGPKTATALEEIGLAPSIIATRPFNSERLLSLFPPALKNLSCLIVTGEGGRTYLAEQLQQRGMTVNSLNVYKRIQPTQPVTPPKQAPAYITVTSQLALENLFAMLPSQANALKQNSTFVALSQRIADYARTLNCQKILVSEEASDSGLVSTIINSH